jgi:hypothetical protein
MRRRTLLVALLGLAVVLAAGVVALLANGQRHSGEFSHRVLGVGGSELPRDSPDRAPSPRRQQPVAILRNQPAQGTPATQIESARLAPRETSDAGADFEAVSPAQAIAHHSTGVLDGHGRWPGVQVLPTLLAIEGDASAILGYYDAELAASARTDGVGVVSDGAAERSGLHVQYLTDVIRAGAVPVFRLPAQHPASSPNARASPSWLLRETVY